MRTKKRTCTLSTCFLLFSSVPLSPLLSFLSFGSAFPHPQASKMGFLAFLSFSRRGSSQGKGFKVAFGSHAPSVSLVSSISCSLPSALPSCCYVEVLSFVVVAHGHCHCKEAPALHLLSSLSSLSSLSLLSVCLFLSFSLSLFLIRVVGE